MPRIPINIADLPTEREDVPENLALECVLRKVRLADTKDKNDNYYLTGMDFEVLAPEEAKGRHVYDNYICIPNNAADNEAGIRLARFAAAFKAPYDAQGFDPNDWLGLTGELTAKNETFEGRRNAKVVDYLI